MSCGEEKKKKLNWSVVAALHLVPFLAPFTATRHCSALVGIVRVTANSYRNWERQWNGFILLSGSTKEPVLVTDIFPSLWTEWRFLFKVCFIYNQRSNSRLGLALCIHKPILPQYFYPPPPLPPPNNKGGEGEVNSSLRPQRPILSSGPSKSVFHSLHVEAAGAKERFRAGAHCCLGPERGNARFMGCRSPVNRAGHRLKRRCCLSPRAVPRPIHSHSALFGISRHCSCDCQ